MNKDNLNNVEKRNEGASLWVHYFIVTLILLEGALGGLIGLKLSSVMLWVPMTGLLLHSLFVIIQSGKGFILSPGIVPILVSIYVLSIWRFITFFWTVNDLMTFKEGVKTIYLLVFIASVYSMMMQVDRNRLLKMVAFVVTFGLVVSLIAYVYQILSEGGLANYGKREFKVNLIIYYKSNVAGAVILLLGLWNWVLVFSGERYRKVGLFNVVLTLFLLFGIASQASLGGYMMSLSIVLLYYFYNIRSRMLLFYLSYLTAFLLAFFSLYVVVMSTTIETLSSANGRLGLWLEALGVFREGSWITGIGSGASRQLLSGTSYSGRDLHNVFLYSLASGGIVELAIVLFVFVWLTMFALKAGRGARVVLVAFVFGIFVRNQAESNGLIFGYLNSSWIFLSWYVLITIFALIESNVLIGRGETHESNMALG